MTGRISIYNRAQRMRRVALVLMRKLLLVISLSVCLVGSNGVTASDMPFLKFKAAYLVNIARFVTWPDTAQSKKVKLCLPEGSDLLAFSEALDGQPVGGDRLLEIATEPLTLGLCDILYLDEQVATQARFAAVTNSTRTLVVAETSDAWARGFVIQLYTRDLKLRLAINEDIVKAAEYTMSSKLLRLYRRLN